MPFDPGDHTARVVPRRRLIVDVFEELLDLGQRRPPHWPSQPMRDLLAQHVVGGQSDGLETACLFQSFIDREDRIDGIGSEEASPKVATSIPGDDGVKDIPPAFGAVDIARAQGAAFQHAKLVEQKVRVIAGAVEMAVQIGERRPGLGRGQTLGLKPPRLRG